MFMNNPFSELSASISPTVMQGYVILMVLLVIGGTVLDMMHKKSAQYFFENAKKAKKSAKRTVSTGEKASIAVKVLANEVLTSGEFCNTRRRLSHLLTMYGFIIFVVTTAIMIFGYPTPATATPAILPQLWHIGALMLAVGGYWFWFFIRVDVSAEGLSWYRFERLHCFGPLRSRAELPDGQPCSWRCSSFPARLFSPAFYGRSSPICSSSPPPLSRSALPGPMVRERICLPNTI